MTRATTVTCPVPAIVATLVLVACQVASPSQPEGVALGESFELRVGESARIDAEALQVEFEGVSADSRCPKGEQCVWEGDATVRVWLQKAATSRESRELHTSSKGPGEASYLTYTVRLMRLDPTPVSGRTIAPSDYVVALELTRGSAAVDR